MNDARTGEPIDWDAAAYQNLSVPQQAWAEEVLDRLALAGDEVVLDLGCGAGQVTEKLVRLVPRGRVIGVDASESMIHAARARLSATAELIRADLRTFSYSGQSDVVFSTATLHWVPDHRSLWTRIRRALKRGGRLEAQYGGAGNISTVVAALPQIARREPFAEFLTPYATPWTFDAPDTAESDLHASGFRDVRTWSETRTARPSDPLAFLANSIVPTERARLPPDLQAEFVDAVFAAIDRPDHYDYVRLNVSATA